VPTGATTGNVVVTVGGLTSNGAPFTVTVPPSITTLSPTSGPVGTAVTITGANFGATQGTSTVAFNGTVATPVERDEPDGAGADRRDDRERRGDGRGAGQQQRPLHGDRTPGGGGDGRRRRAECERSVRLERDHTELEPHRHDHRIESAADGRGRGGPHARTGSASVLQRCHDVGGPRALQQSNRGFCAAVLSAAPAPGAHTVRPLSGGTADPRRSVSFTGVDQTARPNIATGPASTPTVSVTRPGDLVVVLVAGCNAAHIQPNPALAAASQLQHRRRQRPTTWPARPPSRWVTASPRLVGHTRPRCRRTRRRPLISR
jgi:hypothetical protein